MIANPDHLHPLIRRLGEQDLDRVFEIEQSAYPHPWTRGIFSDCLRVGYECWGLQAGLELLAYCVVTHAAGESHLLNLCVAPNWQRQGFGSCMLEHAIRLACRQGCDSMFLEVRPSNPAGIGLYAGRGFQVVGRRRDYYRAGEGREDAIVMQLDLREAAGDPATD
jgi:ribosomal-protein-alanine N-acetyltransferase